METESRKFVRYRLSAPVVFSWTEADHVVQKAEGITRDMSGASVFIWSEACPPVGVDLRCQVFLPKVNPGATHVEVFSRGTITRVERHPPAHHRLGFAVVLGAPMLVRVDERKDQESVARPKEKMQVSPAID